MRRLAMSIGLVLLGVIVAHTTGLEPAGSSAFFLLASSLLAIGLFSSTSAIPIDEVRSDVRVVITAVSFGVLAKAALIAGIMYTVFQQPAYIVLGIAVAQIDPLSVAAMRTGSRLTIRGRAILSAWSSFDDPVTAVLVIMFTGLAVQLGGGFTDSVHMTSDVLAEPTNGFLGNAALAAVLAVVWWTIALLARRWGTSVGKPDTRGRALQFTAIGVLIGAAVTAVANFLMLGLAIAGLYFRPGISRLLERATGLAFAIATCVLGVVLAAGVDLVQGVTLGIVAYLAQVVVGAVVARSLPNDRLRLALGQQSGITAIILALLLETTFPGTVAVVAPAILVVNLLHLTANRLLDRYENLVLPPEAKVDRSGRVNSEIDLLVCRPIPDRSVSARPQDGR